MSSLTAERLYRAAARRLSHPRRRSRASRCARWSALIAQEFEALEENIEQLYDDQFIETCAEWVAPYIGDLIGYRPLHGVAPRIASPRAEVANTIAYRRRKGTALMLEQLARDVTDWPARAVEFFEQLATTQYMNHVRPACAGHRRPARSTRAMLAAGRRRSTASRTPPRCAGPKAAPAATTFPTSASSCGGCSRSALSAVPLMPDPGDATGRKFRFNPLGADLQLFRRAADRGRHQPSRRAGQRAGAAVACA